jgi:hypothetical protein
MREIFFFFCETFYFAHYFANKQMIAFVPIVVRFRMSVVKVLICICERMLNKQWSQCLLICF